MRLSPNVLGLLAGTVAATTVGCGAAPQRVEHRTTPTVVVVAPAPAPVVVAAPVTPPPVYATPGVTPAVYTPTYQPGTVPEIEVMAACGRG